MELLRQQLIAYRPWNEQEERDREELLRRLDSHESFKNFEITIDKIDKFSEENEKIQ